MRLPRFQFSLRTLFVAVTLAAVACAWVGWQVNAVHRRKAILSEIIARGGEVDPGLYISDYQPSLPWWRLKLGDKPIQALVVPEDMAAKERDRIHAMIPEADILQWQLTGHDKSGNEIWSMEGLILGERVSQ